MFDWYNERENISRLTALLAVGLLLSPLVKYRPTLPTKSDDATMAVTMTALAEIIEPPAPQPVLPPSPAPARQAAARQPTAQASPLESPLSSTAPASSEQSPVVTAAVAPAPISPPSAPSLPPAVSHTANAEESYISGVRSYLISIKRYPTGRDASIQRPRGKARIWFVLGRDGRLLESGIDQSSDSLLLDRTAMATVSRGGFPAFPETAWSGQSNHRFTVELEFVPTS